MKHYPDERPPKWMITLMWDNPSSEMCFHANEPKTKATSTLTLLLVDFFYCGLK